MILTQSSQISYQQQNSFNAAQIIRRLNVNNRSSQKKQQANKRQIQTQVRKTSYKVKIKKFSRNANLQMIVAQTKKDDKGYFQETSRNIGAEENFQNFDQFLKRKRVKNAYLKSKMKLFGNSINDRMKATIEREINKQIANIDENKCIQNVSQKINSYQSQLVPPKKRSQLKLADPQKIKKIKKVTVCHMVLDKLLGLMIQNPKLIALKYQNQQLFKSLKQQMLNIIINNEKIIKSIQNVQGDMGLNHTSEFGFSWKKLKDIQSDRKPFYLLKQQKKDQLSIQITKTLQTLEQIIKSSIQDFNKQCKIYQPKQQSHPKQFPIQQKIKVKPRKSIRKSMTSLLKSPLRPLNEQDFSFQGNRGKQNMPNHSVGSYLSPHAW